MSDEKDHREFPNDSAASPIPIIYEHLGGPMDRDHILSLLDKIEGQVEIIRRRAFQIEEDRDAMFTTLHAFEHSHLLADLPELDRDDVDRYIERIYNRCSTIEVAVKTIRDKPQEDALDKINGIIDNLITGLREDPGASKERCLAFMNSCYSYDDNGLEERIFEQALLGCTIDDRERVRRRLQGLMNYIEKLSLSS